MPCNKSCGDAGPWKPWKTAPQFPAAPTALGNRRAIATFPQLRRRDIYLSNRKQKGDQRTLNSHSSGAFFGENMAWLQGACTNYTDFAPVNTNRNPRPRPPPLRRRMEARLPAQLHPQARQGRRIRRILRAAHQGEVRREDVLHRRPQRRRSLGQLRLRHACPRRRNPRRHVQRLRLAPAQRPARLRPHAIGSHLPAALRRPRLRPLRLGLLARQTAHPPARCRLHAPQAPSARVRLRHGLRLASPQPARPRVAQIAEKTRIRRSVFSRHDRLRQHGLARQRVRLHHGLRPRSHVPLLLHDAAAPAAVRLRPPENDRGC